MTPNLIIQTLTLTARDGMKLVVHTCTWLGRVIEVDTYRASDMAQLEIKTLGGR